MGIAKATSPSVAAGNVVRALLATRRLGVRFHFRLSPSSCEGSTERLERLGEMETHTGPRGRFPVESASCWGEEGSVREVDVVGKLKMGATGCADIGI